MLKYPISSVLNILSRKEKIKMGTLIVLDLVICMLDIAFLSFLLLLINFYSRGTGLSNSLLFKLQSGYDPLIIPGLFFLLFGLKNISGYFVSKSTNVFFLKVASRLSKRNIEDYLKESYLNFTYIDSSVLIRKIGQQPIEFSTYILTNIQQVISQSVLIFFTLIAIVFYQPQLFLLLFFLLMPPIILLTYFIRRKLKNVRKNAKEASQKAIQHLQEGLSGYVESNIYNKNPFFTNRYNIHQQQLNQNIATQQTLQGLPSRMIEVFAVMGFLILVGISKYAAHASYINLLNIGIFMAASYKIIPGLVKILNSTGQIKTYEFILADLQPFSNDRTRKARPETEMHVSAVKLEGVGFAYKEQAVLKNFSFEAVSGELVGVFGRSGSGKTTFINILLGFLEESSGTTSINNKICSTAERQSYWPQIAYSKQQPFFINDTILRNIVLTDGYYDIEKFAEIIAICGIDQMIAQYPEAFNTQITENGKNISGGQRQRIILARALYADADLIILDEPFSEMDEATEKGMLVKLQQLAGLGKIIILITHNKASLSYCNKIISLDGE